jgi:hypothetical protein
LPENQKPATPPDCFRYWYFCVLVPVFIILLFNLLGRDLQANQVASVVGNIILFLKGCCWIGLVTC